ncbi:tyrosine-type recombinase/integrase [Sphingomonas sp.]|uniref:tyrosine-type recombinase/integrase n=1 Tax=Sphingomonas sp. TaxID=28214 RepID=UPI0035ADC17E
MGKLTALSVKNAKPGRHADGLGLYLLVKPTGARSWLLRVQVDGQRKDIGLGSVDSTSRVGTGTTPSPIVIPILQKKVLTLAEAREKAALLRTAAKSGLDPIAERDRERRKVPTFKEAAEATHTALKSGWSEKTATVFISSLKNHAYPAIGAMRVDQIDSGHIRDMLAPIWTEIPDMARKVRFRVGKVLDFAKSKGWRTSEGPRKSVTVGLAKQAQGGNYAAMPYGEVPALVAQLNAATPTKGRQALLLTILTAARSGEVRSAQRKHIDLDKAEWNRPPEVMKTRTAHTITLSKPAVELLKQIFEEGGHKPDDLVFPNSKGERLSDMTLAKALRDAGHAYTVHGFRSSFRDWAAEKMPETPDAVAEAALAHIVPDKVIRAYKRAKFLDMRRELLEAWGLFVSSATFLISPEQAVDG